MKHALAISLFLSATLVQGCNAGPDTPRPINKSSTTAGSPQIQSVSHVSEKDQEFAELLQALSQRNPQREASEAMANGTPNILGYYGGRAGLKTPGLTVEQQAKQRCKLNIIDGLGDVIYGENHMKYRIAMRNFAKAYNSSMLTACL